MTEQTSSARKKAEKRVKELKEFYQHVQSYIGVNLLLVAINLFTSPRTLWVRYVLFFWGIGLLCHAASVYFFNGRILGSDWEEKKIDELTKKYNQK